MSIVQTAGVVDEDEKRLFLYLLSDISIRVAIGNDKGKYFKTTVRVPQGDAISPMSFVVYLEHIMREQNRRYPFRDNRRDNVVQYADNTTFAYHQPSIVSKHDTDER